MDNYPRPGLKKDQKQVSRGKTRIKETKKFNQWLIYKDFLLEISLINVNLTTTYVYKLFPKSFLKTCESGCAQKYILNIKNNLHCDQVLDLVLNFIPGSTLE